MRNKSADIFSVSLKKGSGLRVPGPPLAGTRSLHAGQSVSRDQAKTADIEGAPHSPSFSAVSLPPCFTIARTLATAAERPNQAAAARPEQNSGCTGCHIIAHTERQRARKKVHHVEDSMRVRTHSGSHLVVCTPTPTLPSLRCTLRGDTTCRPNQLNAFFN